MTACSSEGDDTVIIDPGAGQTETIPGDIADELGSILPAGDYPSYGERVDHHRVTPTASGLAVVSGTLVLSGDNTFVGGVTIDDATPWKLAAQGSAGIGPITFEPRPGSCLESAAQPARRRARQLAL